MSLSAHAREYRPRLVFGPVQRYGFGVHCSDERHWVNGWPYGQWTVDFEWDRPVSVRVGTREYNMVRWRAQPVA